MEEYDMDSDDFEEGPSRSRNSDRRNVPLLTGLLESSSRRFSDNVIPMHYQADDGIGTFSKNRFEVNAERIYRR